MQGFGNHFYICSLRLDFLCFTILFLQLVPGQQLPSPQELMGKILIKNKKKHPHRASNGGSIRRKDGTDEQSSPLNGMYTHQTLAWSTLAQKQLWLKWSAVQLQNNSDNNLNMLWQLVSRWGFITCWGHKKRDIGQYNEKIARSRDAFFKRGHYMRNPFFFDPLIKTLSSRKCIYLIMLKKYLIWVLRDL